MNKRFLMLKTIYFDPDTNEFRSPTQSDFIWPCGGIITRLCNKGCTEELCNPDCTCGLYGSPNPEALDEYAKKISSIFVVVNCYGWADIWPGPDEESGVPIPYTYAIRTWGMQVFAVVGDEFTTGEELPPARQTSSMKACEYFGVNAYRWKAMKRSIRLSWILNHDQPEPGLRPGVIRDPYDHIEWLQLKEKIGF